MERNRTSSILGALIAAGVGLALPLPGQEVQSCIDSHGQLRILAANEACHADETPLAAAQTGVIAFEDGCTGLLYAMRADGSGRIALPLPPLPLPTDIYWSLDVLNVTTSGPITVLNRVIIGRVDDQNAVTFVDFGLFAVQLSDVGGVLTPDPPVRLSLPEIAGVDPNLSVYASFSPAGSADRLALVAINNPPRLLMTAQVERDAALKITGLSDLVVVGDLFSIGVPDPGYPTSTGFTGHIDYSPDGSSIVASIYYDLWRIHLDSDNTFLSADWLTEDTDGFAEWNPSFSPDGIRIAYTGSPIQSSARNMDIYSLDTASGAVLRVTTRRNGGSSVAGRDNSMWSSDSEWIGFTAFTSRSPRNRPCSWLLNSEIYLIEADGSTTATQITNTNGTSVENYSSWGW